MNEMTVKSLWKRMGDIAKELVEVKRELFVSLSYNKQLIEENDRLQTELLKTRRVIK